MIAGIYVGTDSDLGHYPYPHVPVDLGSPGRWLPDVTKGPVGLWPMLLPARSGWRKPDAPYVACACSHVRRR